MVILVPLVIFSQGYPVNVMTSELNAKYFELFCKDNIYSMVCLWSNGPKSRVFCINFVQYTIAFLRVTLEPITAHICNQLCRNTAYRMKNASRLLHGVIYAFRFRCHFTYLAVQGRKFANVFKNGLTF